MIFFVFQKSWVFWYSRSTLMWHQCYYPHWSRDSMSPVCGILKEYSASKKYYLYYLLLLTVMHGQILPLPFVLLFWKLNKKKLYYVLFRVWMSSKTANFLKCDFAVSGAEKTHTFLPWAPPSSLQHTVPTIGEETAVDSNMVTSTRTINV